MAARTSGWRLVRRKSAQMAAGGRPEDKSWVAEAEERLPEAARWRKHSIYRVPAHVKKSKHASPYDPQLVSLGPLKHGSPELEAMQGHKQRALLHLLRRTGRPSRDLVGALEDVAEQLQDAYMDLDDRWRRDTNAFLRLMVMDGCFLLEVMRTAAQDDGGEAGDYAPSDPVFSRHGELYMFPWIRRDMLVMENQLPLLVLQRLVTVIPGHDAATADSINNMVLKFIALTPDPPEMRDGSLALHPIDVCHRSLLHGVPPEMCKGRKDELMPSATELDQAGIRFAKSSTRSLHDISFLNGVLHFPELTVDDYTEHKLLSIMAFERLHAVKGANEVTAYVFFMDNIIKSAADAQLVCSRGIIWNGLGSNKEVANMFNRLANKAVLDKYSPLRAVHGQVNTYCNKRWNQWRASLIQNHADNPWAVVSLLAAIFLLLLTIVQTLYTVLPYYQDQQPTQAGWPTATATAHLLHDEL